MGLRDQNAGPHTCLARALSSGLFSQTRNISLSTTQEGKTKNIRHGSWDCWEAEPITETTDCHFSTCYDWVLLELNELLTDARENHFSVNIDSFKLDNSSHIGLYLKNM